MSLQRTKGTTPELLLRRALFARGLRYRINHPVPTMPRRSIDVAFTSKKLAVFVDGCFWHACPDHGVAPKHGAMWWHEKLAKNVQRDRETDEALAKLGWRVVRIWEHVEASEAAEIVIQALGESPHSEKGPKGLAPPT